MRLTCWVTKTTNTTLECVTLITFSQQWLHERVSVSPYTHVACPVKRPSLISYWYLKYENFRFTKWRSHNFEVNASTNVLLTEVLGFVVRLTYILAYAMWYPLNPQSENQCLCLQYSSVHCVVHTPTVQSFQSSLDQTPFAAIKDILPNVPMGPVVKFHLIHCCPEACMSAVSIVSAGNIEGARFFPAWSGPGYWDDCCHHPCIRNLF